ncbi:LuxR C-terminal-related transcriptional regulator [Streptomyces scopuliridis]|uniref:helix-turn-helix transcriptional regulator n=1 Tax=Streptomyces scopuliridis TaxID=452529 RepID=UPI0036CCC31F
MAGEAGLRRMLAVVDLLIDAVDEESLLPALLPLLLRAVPGDSVVWTPHPDPVGRPLTLPAGLLGRDALKTFACVSSPDPLVTRTTSGSGTSGSGTSGSGTSGSGTSGSGTSGSGTSGSGAPMLRSALRTHGQYHALAAYADVYRVLGAEHQLAMAFPAGYVGGAPRRVCLAINRSGRGGARDFADHDLATAVLLRARLGHALNRLAPPTPELVTDREAAVLDLVARGLTNQQVAHRLAISPRTVDKHLEHAYAKLRVGGRVEAANAWQARALL